MPPPPPPTATTSARPRAPPTIIDLKSVISTRQPLTVDDSHFDQTRSHINRFVKCLEDWAEVHQSELVEEEQAHFRAVAEGQAEVRRLKGEIEGVRGSVEKIIDDINAQQAELARNQEAVGEQRARRQKQQNLKNMLTQEIEQVKTSVSKLRTIHEADQRAIDAQLSLIKPKHDEYQKALAIQYQPIQPDIIRIIFTQLDPHDPEREFSFLVDVSQDDYRVPSSNPQLSLLPPLVDALNKNRDFGTFLKRVRAAFEVYINEERG